MDVTVEDGSPPTHVDFLSIDFNVCERLSEHGISELGQQFLQSMMAGTCIIAKKLKSICVTFRGFPLLTLNVL